MKKIIFPIIISLILPSLNAQNDDATLIRNSKDDIYRLSVTEIYVTNGVDKRPVTHLTKNVKGKDVKTAFTWQGTGFLLDDGRFVTSRRNVQPWRYTDITEILRQVAYADSRQGYRIEATVKATSSNGRTLSFKTSDFTFNDSSDEKQQLGAYDDGMSCWAFSAITGKDPQIRSTDWAYIRTSFKGKLTSDSTMSNNMRTNTELHILGFAGQTAIAAGKLAAPVYTKSQTAYDGLEEGGCFPYIDSGSVEYSGSPVLIVKNNRPVVVGVAAYGSAQSAGRKYAVPVSALTVGNKNENSFSAITAVQEDIPVVDMRQLIEKAVDDGVFMIRQRYRLRNKTTNKYYGWNNEPYFGTVYSLAIRTVNGYYASNAALRPWEYDARYDQYRSDKTFEPSATTTGRRQLSVRTWTDQTIDPKSYKEDPNMPLVWIKSADFDNQGFMPADKKVDDDSWIVWLASARPLAEWGVSSSDTASLSYLIYSSKHRYENGKTVCEITAPDADARALIGGMCIVPFVAGPGQVEFRVSGILAQKDGKWYAVQPSLVDLTVQSTDRDGKLTPVDGNKPANGWRRIPDSPFK